jgi:Fe-S cluster assembly protein SufD
MAVPVLKIEGAEALLAAAPAPSGEAAWARSAREKAAARLRAMGAPIRRDEYWRYTDPASLTVQPAKPAPVYDAVEKPPFDDVDRLRIVFVDGVYDPAASDPLDLAGIEIQTLAEAAVTDIHWARDLFGVLEERGQNPVDRPLTALNTARAAQGIVINVTGQAARPVNFIYRHASDTSDGMVHHLIRMAPGSDLTLLENGAAAARFNSVLEVEIAEDASFHHVRTQGRAHDRRAATAIFARLGARSSFKSFTMTVNGRLTRNECVIEFTGDDAHARVAGAAIGEGEFLHDDTIFITHDALNCESRQVFKKVLRNGATGVFQGKILVKKDAQKTDGYQISQGLLLDDDSNFLAKPELEIYADDVACSHGSTCGAVDETSLFYLTSRGLPRAEAEGLLVLAFLDEAIQEIEDPALADDMRDRLGAWLARRGRL